MQIICEINSNTLGTFHLEIKHLTRVVSSKCNLSNLSLTDTIQTSRPKICIIQTSVTITTTITVMALVMVMVVILVMLTDTIQTRGPDNCIRESFHTKSHEAMNIFLYGAQFSSSMKFIAFGGVFLFYIVSLPFKKKSRQNYQFNGKTLPR